MPDFEAPQAQPTVPPDRTIPRPINTGKIALYFLMGLCGLVMIANVTHLGSGPSKAPPAGRLPSKPVAVDPDSINGFAQRQAADIARLKQEAEKAEKLIASSSAPINGAELMPPCDASLAGARGTAPDRTPIVCGTDGSWHRMVTGPPGAPQAQSGVPTPAQEEAQRRKVEQEKRQQLALNSTTVAVDFSDKDKGKEPDSPQPARNNSPTPPVSTPPSGAVVNNTAALARPSDPATAVNGENHTAKATPDWFSHSGKLHRIFEGTILETVLTNRINGSFAGPIDAMLTTDVYSHDHQTLLIPQGTRCLGTVSAVGSTKQQRLFVAFHRCIMPDGYPLDLDKFAGLNEAGETALRDLVNHHYLQIFGASLAIGAIGGLAQIGNSTSALIYDPGAAIRNGVSAQMAQEAIEILDRFLNQLPTFVVRERTRVKIYISSDLEVPAYDAHIIDPAI
jgi:type IV secretion system protein VirB10